MGHTHTLGFLFFLGIIFYFSNNVLAKDDTLHARAKGKDVTEAVLGKISRIFKQDNSFLFRLAYVESKFGEDDATFRQDYYGGIWQVEESFFEITQDPTSTLSPLHKAIHSKFKIDWLEVKWKQLVIPLYSGLAAALYFARISETEADIPETISDQATYWKKYYRSLGSTSKFEHDSNQLRNLTSCRGKMDLCIVLDGSGSIDEENFEKAKDSVASLIQSFTLDKSRIGMVVYSETPTTIFQITNVATISQLADQARKADYPGSTTGTGSAIDHAIKMFPLDSTSSSGVPKIMVVFTDGHSNTGLDITDAVAGLRDNKIISVAVGIGDSINDHELLQIALNERSRVFKIQGFTSLHDLIQEITLVACKTKQSTSLDGNPIHDDLQKYEKRIYEAKVPPEGITVDLTDISGKTNGYYSYTDKAPSKAVHDGELRKGTTYIPPPPAHPRAKRAIEEDDEYDEESEENYVEENEENNESYVYITIEGVEDFNNYTLSFVEGNQAGDDDENGARLNVLTKYALIFFMFLLTACN